MMYKIIMILFILYNMLYDEWPDIWYMLCHGAPIVNIRFVINKSYPNSYCPNDEKFGKKCLCFTIITML